MKKIVILFISLLGNMLLVTACKAGSFSPGITLVGSTPCNSYIGSVLNITPGADAEFIKWKIVLKDEGAGKQTFDLDLNFGQSQPNTTGFVNGGQKRTLHGSYVIQTEQIENVSGMVYRLQSDKLTTPISLLKINENIFQILSKERTLLSGGGDYSYSLNRESIVKSPNILTSLVSTAFAPTDKATTIIFDARTPCWEIAGDNGFNVAADCFKLKWKLTLRRDPTTLSPTTFTIERTDKRQNAVDGNWAIIKGSPSQPNIIIYRLSPSTSDPAILLFVGDHNVLFLQNKDGQLYTGNELHSYTFNRRSSN
ncbi:hypothetical protein ACFQZS_10390 [Mucilaginibacter calamicampi]|uniref:Lipocalin-like domain-containing protein n=1 Tax=Mucilaginibacter calamicampi TaxID=1302352 RepID=A0ABW2YXK4_9SPHI